jgi:hypothetical protein
MPGTRPGMTSVGRRAETEKGLIMLQRFGENLPAREVKFAPCDLKRVEADGTFAGYASLFGEVDLGQDW